MKVTDEMVEAGAEVLIQRHWLTPGQVDEQCRAMYLRDVRAVLEAALEPKQAPASLPGPPISAWAPAPWELA